jgi:hypothetical protein
MQMNVAGLRRNIKNLAHNYSDAQVSELADKILARDNEKVIFACMCVDFKSAFTV